MKFFSLNRRLLSLVVTGLVIAVLTLSSAFIITHLHHDCTGEGCSVCTENKACASVLRLMSEAAWTGAVGSIACIGSKKRVFSYLAGLFLSPVSLVSLKIRLDN
ncbi:AraC family transcriptional regulator [Lachnospiraceae bacterium 54-53]